VEFPKNIYGYWRMHVSKPPCKFWDLEHIQCYQKSTFPLSEECALAMQPVEASLWSVTSSSALLMSDILSTNYCASVAFVLLLTLPLTTLHLYCNSISILHPCCCWHYHCQLHLHYNLLQLLLLLHQQRKIIPNYWTGVQYDASRCWSLTVASLYADPLKPLCCCWPLLWVAQSLALLATATVTLARLCTN